MQIYCSYIQFCAPVLVDLLQMFTLQIFDYLILYEACIGFDKKKKKSVSSFNELFVNVASERFNKKMTENAWSAFLDIFCYWVRQANMVAL